MNTTLTAMPANRSKQPQPPGFSAEALTHHKAWVANAAKQPMTLEIVDLGPLGAEDVEIAVEHCGLCHSDLSILNNDWGISQYPAILGHEVIGRVTAVGPNAKGVTDRPARWRGLALGKLHALSPVHVGQPSPLPASAIHHRRASRWFREPYPCALGLDDPTAGASELRRGRATALWGQSPSLRRSPCTPSRPVESASSASVD